MYNWLVYLHLRRQTPFTFNNGERLTQVDQRQIHRVGAGLSAGHECLHGWLANFTFQVSEQRETIQHEGHDFSGHAASLCADLRGAETGGPGSVTCGP
jgi:hypothetical protein